MDKRRNLASRALAALVCLAMVLAWVPGEAMAKDDDPIHVKVLFSNVYSHRDDETLSTSYIKAVYENDTQTLSTLKGTGIGTYKGHPIEVTTVNCTTSGFDAAIKKTTVTNTQFLIIITPNTSLLSVGYKLRSYLAGGGCIWLCGEHIDYNASIEGGNKYISELAKSLGVQYNLDNKTTVYAVGKSYSGEKPNTNFSEEYLADLDSTYLAKLDKDTQLGKPNDYGEHSYVILSAANPISYTDSRFRPVITYQGNAFMIDAPVEKGFLTVSADENLFQISTELQKDRLTPWAAQIFYNFLDRSVQKIEEVSTGTVPHAHNWAYAANKSTLYAYCIQEPGAGEDPCDYFVASNDREDVTEYSKKAVIISTSTPDMEYSGNAYDKLTQEDQDFKPTGLGIKDVTTVFYRAGANGGPEGDPLPEGTAPIEAGFYVAVATLTVGDKEFKAMSSFEIKPKAPSVTASGYTGVYDGQPHSITVDGTNVTYSTDGTNYTANNPSYTYVGTHTVYYKADNGAAGTATVRITPRTAGLRWSEETVFRYDGDPHAPAAEATDLLPGDECTVTVSGAQTEPGTYTAEAAGLSNPNYRLPTSGTTQEFNIYRESSGASSTPAYPIIVRDGTPDGGLVRASRDWAQRGATVTVTAEPLDGFRLEQVTAVTQDGKSLRLTEKEGAAHKYTFAMPADKVFVEAVFSPEESASTAGAGGEDEPAEPVSPISACSRATACPIWPFFDANPSDWYHDAVHYCLENGLMTGYGDASLRLQADISRAEALVMLWRLQGSPAADGSPAFTDVAESAWYAGAVRWAASEGIVLGTGGGCFTPDGTLTHQQLDTILQRCAQAGKLEAPDDWDALLTAREDGTPSPTGPVSRVQAAVALADFGRNMLN